MELIPAAWAAPARIRAFTTTRAGGVSRGPFASLNLASHVDDDETAVGQNRRRVADRFGVPAEPVWLRQVHGARIVQADAYTGDSGADGGFTATPGVVCAVLTADCLPLFMCSRDGDRVGLFHIGWRGLAKGLVASAAELFGRPGAMAWLGPAIGPRAFEIGEEVKSEIESALEPRAACFARGENGRWRADLYALVAAELARFEVACGYDADLCTFSDPHRFFSYRRSRRCGRMASMIWIEP